MTCNNNNDCPTGKRCSNGTCQDYTCSAGSSKCRSFSDCFYTSVGTCEANGCCAVQQCLNTPECPVGFRCQSGECVSYICNNPSDPKCHSDSDCPGSTYQCSPSGGGGCCVPQSPIVIDIEGDGYLLTSGNNGVRFDITGTGNRGRLAWTASGSDDGFLALDRNGNGRIDDGKELFGNVTAQPEGPEEKQGFRALAVFDKPAQGGNQDGWINAQDAIYTGLLIWQDFNHNGISERAELTDLPRLGITGISLDYKEAKWVDMYGNQFRYRAKVDREGRGRGKDKWAYDVFLVRGQ